MTAIDINQTLIESYLNLLNPLSLNNKLELISRLSQSMRSAMLPKTSVYDLFGAFQSDQPAEQLISEIHQARFFHRQREAF
jgi:hypothetical protein